MSRLAESARSVCEEYSGGAGRSQVPNDDFLKKCAERRRVGRGCAGRGRSPARLLAAGWSVFVVDGPADGLVDDDDFAVLEFSGQFAGEGVRVDEAAHDGGQAFGGGVEVDVLVGGADVAAPPGVVFGGEEQVHGGVVDEALPRCQRDEVFVVDFDEGVGRGFVAPGAFRGEEVEPHVLQVARGGDGALAAAVHAPGNPEDFAEGLVVDATLGVVAALGVALVDGLHQRNAAFDVGGRQLFRFC